MHALLFDAAVAGLILFSSLRSLFKYVPSPLIASFAFGIFVFIGLRFVRKVSFPQKLQQLLLALGTLTVLVLTLFIYPIADRRKEAGLGSTSDDAMIESFQNFVNTGKMYDHKLYDGAPVSPGPAWILMNAPFESFKRYPFLTFTYLLSALLMIILLLKQTTLALQFLTILLSSLLFWELTVTGHDLVAVGLMIFALSLGFFYLKAPTLWVDCGLWVLLGCLATSRIVFIFLPFLFAAFLWKTNFRRAVLTFAFPTLLALAFHAYFYTQSEFYQPLHLLGRGRDNVGFPLMACGALLAFIFFIYAQRRYAPDWRQVGIWFSGCLAIPFFFISVGELQKVDFVLRSWEGANYLMPFLPCMLFYLLSTDKRLRA